MRRQTMMCCLLAFVSLAGQSAFSDGELADVIALYEAQLKWAEADDDATEQIVEKQVVPEGTSALELAAWIIVGRTLINLDEFITRE